jgi:nitroreductase
MPILDLSIDEVLSTTRSVRKRLDLTRPVEPEVIRECLELAVQAPTPGSSQNWHFIVVTDQAQREALAALYRRNIPSMREYAKQAAATAPSEAVATKYVKGVESAVEYAEHLHEVPVYVVPCVEGRIRADMSVVEQAGHWGGILPATWSFMLAARSRGLGTVLTTLHLEYEREAAEILGIPYERILQIGLIPVAYTLGTEFKRGPRKPLNEVLHWDRW